MIHLHIVQQFHFLIFLLSEFALSPNNNEVHIYAKKGGKWEVEHVLKNVRWRVVRFSLYH